MTTVHCWYLNPDRGLPARIREKQLLAANFVPRYNPLPRWRCDPINELLRLDHFDLRMPGRADRHHAVLVKQSGIAFNQDRQVGTVFK